jgi:predicted PolB exonuclease-like 3'-5' exonuclease
MATPVRFLVFDVESSADGDLVSRLRYPGENLSAADAIRRYRDELMKKNDSDFIPYTYHIPRAVIVAKVSAQYQLIDLVALDEPQYRPHVITENFWRGWEKYDRPTLVSFNGRTFDIPVLELAAFRFGISIPAWFALAAKSFEQPRNRFNLEDHLDLQEVLTNFGSTRFNGGLNLAANLLGKPGKMDVQGDMVQDMFDTGKMAEINDYCRCDVLDTYFVFLRSRVLVGLLTLAQEHTIIEQTKSWLEANASTQRAYQMYLDRWGDWPNPWGHVAGAPKSGR